MTKMHTPSHISVLQNEVLTKLITPETKTVFDGTLGLGGHAELILKTFPSIESYIATDLDAQHLSIAQENLRNFSEKITLHNGSFSEIDTLVSDQTPRPISILLDLGLCSNHVDDPEKGFSFAQDGPLKMSFDEDTRAEEFLNSATEKEITRVLYTYGEIKNALRIARGIIKEREEAPIKTTKQLKEIIEKNTPAQLLKKVLPLAFQAIRIEVNNELSVLEETLEKALNLMKPKDKIGVISYHSLEDRIVKKRFLTASKPITQSDNFSLHTIVQEAEFFTPTKKPILPSEEEIEKNPRSRSAKLRILEKK